MLPKRWGFRLWLDCVLETTQRKSGFFLRLLHNRKQRALFAFLTIVPIKSQVYLQQQTKQSSSRNIQGLKVFGNFVSGCVFLLLFFYFLRVEISGHAHFYLKIYLLTCNLLCKGSFRFCYLLIWLLSWLGQFGRCRSCWGQEFDNNNTLFCSLSEEQLFWRGLETIWIKEFLVYHAATMIGRYF